MCEQFVAIKSSMLENTINANFKMVEFKLFNELINGGIEETCEATINGVPYASVNNAGKINAGLDIHKCIRDLFMYVVLYLIFFGQPLSTFIS